MTRLGALQEVLDDLELDALVVSTPANIRYLSGFTGSAGTLVVRPDAAVLITDGRYALQAPDEIRSAGADVEIRIDPSRGFGEIVAATATAAVVGAEASHLSWAQADRLAAALPGELRAEDGIVETLRERKDVDEVERIRAAAAIADAALAAVVHQLGSLPTERAFGAALEAAMRSHGADRPAFDTIVASGPNAARPHHRPGTRALEAGDLVIVDFGAELHGYRSDMTRTFSIGEPSVRAHELLEAVRGAQAAGVAAAGPGVAVAEIDAACRNHLASLGLDEYFTHGTGHGVGLDIHEAPSVSSRATATLAPGHVITVEPGVYLPGFGGVRWEDTLVITDDGAAALTTAPKEPLIDLPNT